MKYNKKERCARFSRKSFLFIVLLSLSNIASECVPRGCGPGDIDNNPIHSNLVDKTDPASGSVLRPDTFAHFHVYFLSLIDETTFSVDDDIGMCIIEEGNESCEPEFGTNMVSRLFTTTGWACHPESFGCGSNLWNKLELGVSMVALNDLEEGYYLVRIRKDGPETPIQSDQGFELEDHVDIYLRYDKTIWDTQMPYPYAVTPEINQFVSPHQKFSIYFSERMGFINVVSSQILGFNFKQNEGERELPNGDMIRTTILNTDSIQGLSPGVKYHLDFLSSDSAPNGVPYSMDLHGNLLRRIDTDKPTTTHLEFNTSHVRIHFPLHTPFLDRDDWYDQISSSDYDRPFFQVHVSNDSRAGDPDIPLVAEIRCDDPSGMEGDITFPARTVSTPGESFSIPAVFRNIDEAGISVLEVHAYDVNDNWLGSDKLRVTAQPDIWLSENPWVADHIVWQDKDVGPIQWNNWSASRKKKLRVAFYRTRDWFDRGFTPPEPVGFDDPLPNIAAEEEPRDNTYADKQVLEEEDAWDLYLSSLAMSLVVEIDGHVPWTIADFNGQSLRLLLDSQTMFLWSNSYNGYKISFSYTKFHEWTVDMFDPGYALPGRASHSYRFLRQHNYIYKGDEEPVVNMFYTLGNLLNWCRDNAVHFAQNVWEGNMYNHWQYIGFHPVQRILDGTDCQLHYCNFNDGGCLCPEEDDLNHNYITGCHGMAGFLRAVLRSINIPAMPNYLDRTKHAFVQFTELSLYLFGDDPFRSSYKYATPLVPGAALLIEESDFQEWFLTGTNEERLARHQNKQRQINVLYLPNHILKMYCLDEREGNLPSNGHVVEWLTETNLYTYQELVNVYNLWNNIEAKVQTLGGCSTVSQLEGCDDSDIIDHPLPE